MVRYRSHLEILVDILSLVKEGARRTHIMYRANLSFKLLDKYLNEVLTAGLARLGDDGFYKITEKGLIFLDKCNVFLKHDEDFRFLYEEIEDKRKELESLLST